MILKALKKRGFTLIELMIVVAIIGILAAIAIPNFVRFQARSKQGEAKTNLKALFTAQKSYYAEKDAFNNNCAVFGWSPEGGNRYYYVLNTATGVWTRPSSSPAAGYGAITPDTSRFGTIVAPSYGFTATDTNFTAAAPGVVGTCPTCGFIANAQGNVDNDSKIDQWMITSHDGTNAGSGTVGSTCGVESTAVTAGVPFLLQNDVSCD
jgi:type IV pilus assembly protein PilA